jgi:hypothetical protein
LSVISLLSTYYIKESDSISEVYNMTLMSEDYVGKLYKCMEFVESIYQYIKINTTSTDKWPHLSKLAKLTDEFNKSNINMYIKTINYDVCKCGSVMKIFPELSELICPSCGSIVILHGTVFEDTQFYYQEGQRSKHGCYDPSRHCKFWVQRIQANDNIVIDKGCIDAIMKCIKRDGITDNRRLLCSQIRGYLKETGFTEYNNHVPMIRKIITGQIPPQLTQDELRRLYNLFNKAIHAFESIKPPDKSNMKYYPYIIFKILDLILESGVRKKKIIECIHLQSRETLIANDNIWENICKIVKELKYVPTDRFMYSID